MTTPIETAVHRAADQSDDNQRDGGAERIRQQGEDYSGDIRGAPHRWPQRPRPPRALSAKAKPVHPASFEATQARRPQRRHHVSPEQRHLISALARGFATFDHWAVRSALADVHRRSFYHAAGSSGFVVNASYENFPLHNDAENHL